MTRVGIACNIGGVLAVVFVLSLYSFYYAPNALETGTHSRTTVDLAPGNRPDNLLWIVQVSDIHISRYWDPQRIPDFKDFCIRSLGTITPDVVLVTGDLTDAKSKNKLDSVQYLDEWQSYQQVIEDSDVTRRYIWLDIRGNHDAFDVINDRDPNSNPYLKYSGDKGKQTSKVYHLKKPYGKYSFIPVDATMIPGPRRPYNFGGYLSEEKMKRLESFQSEALESNFTIWYSHYPTSSITSRSPGIRNLVGETGSLYIAGHLHTLGGLSSSLYALNSKGFVELEVADWQWDRTYRIIAIDHDLMSFTDLKYNEWPAVLLTNPKSARLMMPKFEPLKRIAMSTHIRFLIFDPWEIDEVHVRIDGKEQTGSEKPNRVNGTNLWVSRWDTSAYLKGMHAIEITVQDSKGNTKTVSQQFSLDDTWTVDFGWLSPFIIMSDFPSLLFCIFHTIVFTYIAVLILFKSGYLNCAQAMVMRLTFLLKDNLVFYGLVLFPLNLAIGPWFAGQINRGRIGVCFSYGLLVDGVFQPDDVTLYKDGIGIVLVLYIPATLFLMALNYTSGKGKNTLQRAVRWPLPIFLVVYLLFIIMNFYATWSLYQSYGYMATLFSPYKLWWTCFLICTTIRIYNKDYKI